MDLRLSEVARLLNETEDKIYQWAHEGTVPAHRIHEQYFFNRVELQEWATARGRSFPPEVFAAAGAPPPQSLRAALERGGIYYQVPGKTCEEVLTAVAQLPGVPAQVDRSLLAQLLISRERMASTGIGEGMAIPHTRDPVVVHIDEPILLLCFLEQPIDFNAIDGQPVRVLFTLLSPTVPQHLHTLSRLAFALHDPLLRELLRTKAPVEVIGECVAGIEQRTTINP